MRNKLGVFEFESYLATPNYLPGSDKKVDIFDLYCKDLGDLNAAERKALSEDDRAELLKFQSRNGRYAVQVENVDTHQISTHKSADESHVTAFRMMVEAQQLGVVATYETPVKLTDPSRKVTITKRGNLDAFVAGKNAELKKQIDELVALDDAGIYNKYLRYNDVEEFKNKEYKALADDEKEKFREKIKGFRFQAKAAKRFMDNMINDHKCNSGGYGYSTNIPDKCGLSMEEMVAVSYWASKDKANFRKNATEVGNFISLIKQLHDMRRGYDIDHGIDKPYENKYPDRLGNDNHRCQGGCVNSLSWGLKSGHKAYNPVLILRTDIEREIRIIYTKIVEDNLNLFEGKNEIIMAWNSTGKITGEVRKALKEIFEVGYKKEFVDNWEGYINDKEFYNVIENALDDIPVPEQLKGEYNIEGMSAEEIYHAIATCKLPLLHSDPERGIESTLNYLNSLSGKEGIVDYLINRAISKGNKEPSVQRVLHFLSHSQITQSQRDVEVTTIKGKSVTIGDLAGLSTKALNPLFTLTAENFLEETARQNYADLFSLYARKVELTDEELNKGFGSDESTPLMLAAIRGDVKLVKLLLSKNVDVNKANKKGITPVSYASGCWHIEVVKLLIEAGADLNIADEHGQAPIHFAAKQGCVEVVKELFKHASSNINKADKEGWTPLNLAAYRGEIEVVKFLLEKGADVNKANKDCCTPLFWAASKGNIEVAKVLLAHGASPSLNLLLKNTFSSEINSKMRINYVTSIPSFIFSPIINMFKSIANFITQIFTTSREQEGQNIR